VRANGFTGLGLGCLVPNPAQMKERQIFCSVRANNFFLWAASSPTVAAGAAKWRSVRWPGRIGTGVGRRRRRQPLGDVPGQRRRGRGTEKLAHVEQMVALLVGTLRHLRPAFAAHVGVTPLPLDTWTFAFPPASSFA
jgi:hypothetical protein